MFNNLFKNRNISEDNCKIIRINDKLQISFTKNVVLSDNIQSKIKKILHELNLDKYIILKTVIDSTYDLRIKKNFYLLNNKNINDYIKLLSIIKKAKTIPNLSLVNNPILNQMLRIKDGQITATKMILMHLVTGQYFKHPMAEETICLTKNLYNSTNISFVNDTLIVGGSKYINYKEKYLKYRTKYLKLKYN